MISKELTLANRNPWFKIIFLSQYCVSKYLVSVHSQFLRQDKWLDYFLDVCVCGLYFSNHRHQKSHYRKQNIPSVTIALSGILEQGFLTKISEETAHKSSNVTN